MSQAHYWDKEYLNPQFLSLNKEPQQDILRFMKWLKQEEYYDPTGKVFLDLGCGNGRNANYLAEHYGCAGFGWDIAPEAIVQAKQDNVIGGVTYAVCSMGEAWALEDDSIDLILDNMASPSLYAGERKRYLAEMARVLKPDGYAFVRVLLIDGDRNAKNLIDQFAGPEEQTYIHPDTLIIEHVFGLREFEREYGELFTIKSIAKQTGYQRWGAKSFKRRYLVAYLQKKTA
ncbi:MAG: SAM-dependent methyltransferase [Planctomycetota bacterium]|jgi:SAM-dependent methyltransferase